MVSTSIEEKEDDDYSLDFDKFIADNKRSQLELYDWQKRAMAYFEKNPESIFEVVTGVGKTQLAIELIKKLWKEDPSLKVLVVVPKNVILESGWYKEFYDNGFMIKDIGIFYGKGHEMNKITLTNMQNVDDLPLELFQVLIADELHNYSSSRLLKIIQHPFKYKIGLSATIDIKNGNPMKILKAFKYHIFEYGPKEALKDGVLNQFIFYNVGVHLDDVTRQKYDDLTQQINVIIMQGKSYGAIMHSNSPLKFTLLQKMSERTQMVNNYVGKFEVVKAVCEKHKGDKILVFNQFNEQTTKLYWHLLDVGIKAGVIHSNINKQLQEEVLINFKLDKNNILLCSRMLDEGYNIPKTDVAVIMANNSTKRQLVQRIGRVLRKKDKISYIYEVYCLGTIEEDYNKRREKFFISLANKYHLIEYKDYDKFQEAIR